MRRWTLRPCRLRHRIEFQEGISGGPGAAGEPLGEDEPGPLARAGQETGR